MKMIMFAAGAVALALGSAPVASAVTPQEICHALDVSPTGETVVRGALQGMHDGQTPEQVGENFVVAATVVCPQHYDLIVAVMNRFAEQDPDRAHRRVA